MLAMIFSPPSGCAMHAVTRVAERQVRAIPLRFDDHRRRRVERPQLVADEREQRDRARSAQPALRNDPAATPAPIASSAISGTM